MLSLFWPLAPNFSKPQKKFFNHLENAPKKDTHNGSLKMEKRIIIAKIGIRHFVDVSINKRQGVKLCKN